MPDAFAAAHSHQRAGIAGRAIEDIDAGRYDKLYREASDEWRSVRRTGIDRNVAETARETRQCPQSQSEAARRRNGTAPVAGTR